MYLEDYKQKLERQRIRIANTDYYPADKVNDILEMIANSSVRWDEEDFQHAAIQKTNETEWQVYYNKEAFSTALYEMVHRHDASIGITWDTVYYYLDEYCKIKDFKNIYNDNHSLK